MLTEQSIDHCRHAVEIDVQKTSADSDAVRYFAQRKVERAPFEDQRLRLCEYLLLAITLYRRGSHACAVQSPVMNGNRCGAATRIYHYWFDCQWIGLHLYGDQRGV